MIECPECGKTDFDEHYGCKFAAVNSPAVGDWYCSRSHHETFYKIYSIEHEAWWKPFKQGYCKNWNYAGIYCKKNALEILNDANQHGTINEALVPVDVNGDFVKVNTEPANAENPA